MAPHRRVQNRVARVPRHPRSAGSFKDMEQTRHPAFITAAGDAAELSASAVRKTRRGRSVQMDRSLRQVNGSARFDAGNIAVQMSEVRIPLIADTLGGVRE